LTHIPPGPKHGGGSILWPLVVALIAGWAIYRLVRFVRKKQYFASEEFVAHKARIRAFVSEHNELKSYVHSIHENGTFQLGTSTTGNHAHLAKFENTSKHNYRRDRNEANYGATNIHNCSLQVARKAAADPLTYLMKYFGIKANQENLTVVEAFNESISRLENALENLQQREESIAAAINPPPFILKHYKSEFMEHVGVELSSIQVPYPVYLFEYVSAGGNSSQRTTIKLDGETTDELIEIMSQKIKFRKSVAGQRALMTSKLRTFIKERDKYTCQYCSISVTDEPHLLLEIDHKIPLSKGGMTAKDNLQTLCWKCNRSKSNKLPHEL